MGEPRNRYSTVSLVLHWGIAAAVLIQVLLITAHENTEGPLSGQFVMLHKSTGITILVLTLARIGWRLAHPAIPLPVETPRWQRWTARATHVLFYVGLSAMPMTGWLATSAAGREITWFGLFDWPLLPVGGGGLAAGVSHYFAERGRVPRFVFCEPAGAPSLKESLAADKRVKLAKVDNFVDGAAVAEIGREPFRHLKGFSQDDVRLVPENRLCATMIEMLNVEGVVLEPAGALAIDALKDFPRKEIKGKTVVAVVSGGNFDFERLPDVKERALRFEGLKKYFIIRFPQRPGALRDFLEMLGPDDDIARFEYLKKSARNFGSVLIGIETKDRRNFDLLLANFDTHGVQYQDITENETLAGFILLSMVRTFSTSFLDLLFARRWSSRKVGCKTNALM